MRKLFWLSILVLMPFLPAYGISVVNAKSCAGAATACTGTATSLTAGNQIDVLCLGDRTANASLVLAATDSQSDVFNPIGAQAFPNTTTGVEMFQAINIAGGSTTVTCTNTSTGATKVGFTSLQVNGAPYLDTSNQSAIASSTAWQLTSGISTGAASEIVIQCAGTGAGTESSYTADTSYTIPAGGSISGSSESIGCQYQVVSSTGSFNPTITVATARVAAGVLVSFAGSAVSGKAFLGGNTFLGGNSFAK